MVRGTPWAHSSDPAPEEQLGEYGRELDALLERLAVRLGPEHDAVRAFKAADEAVLRIWRAAGLLRLEPESDGDEAAERQIQRLSRERRTRSKKTAPRSTPRECFVAAAHAAAGSRLK
jgi:hypothetical protein